MSTNPTTRATARTTTPLTFTYYRGYDSTGAAYPDGPLAIIRGLTFEQAKREFEADDRQGFIECEQTGAGYYGDEYPWLTRDGRVVPSPLEQAEGTTKCRACNGTGCDPMSDVTNSLLCPSCQGTGRAQASSPSYLDRLECLRRCIVAASEIEDDLREHGFERGNARYAAEILARARRALAEHLQAELSKGGAA
ncbi:MAG: hypothetical protein Kow0060_01690 [Methylohalobius crimeensis]